MRPGTRICDAHDARNGRRVGPLAGDHQRHRLGVASPLGERHGDRRAAPSRTSSPTSAEQAERERGRIGRRITHARRGPARFHRQAAPVSAGGDVSRTGRRRHPSRGGLRLPAANSREVGRLAAERRNASGLFHDRGEQWRVRVVLVRADAGESARIPWMTPSGLRSSCTRTDKTCGSSTRMPTPKQTSCHGATGAGTSLELSRLARAYRVVFAGPLRNPKWTEAGILLVDDYSRRTEGLARALSALGYDVLTAGHGRACRGIGAGSNAPTPSCLTSTSRASAGVRRPAASGVCRRRGGPRLSPPPALRSPLRLDDARRAGFRFNPHQALRGGRPQSWRSNGCWISGRSPSRVGTMVPEVGNVVTHSRVWFGWRACLICSSGRLEGASSPAMSRCCPFP